LTRDPAARTAIIAVHTAIADAIGRHDERAAERLAEEGMAVFISRLERAFPAFLERPVDWL